MVSENLLLPTRKDTVSWTAMDIKKISAFSTLAVHIKSLGSIAAVTEYDEADSSANQQVMMVYGRQIFVVKWPTGPGTCSLVPDVNYPGLTIQAAYKYNPRAH